MLKSLRNENLLQSTFSFFFFFLQPAFSLLLKAYMYVEFPTMNFNFTLHFLESYFQFNRKYLFEVILHFSPSLSMYFIPLHICPQKRGVFFFFFVEGLCTRQNHFSCILLEFLLTVYICTKRKKGKKVKHSDVMSRNKLI